MKSKINYGDLIRFSGMYIVNIGSGRNETVMSSIPREGIVMGVGDDYVQVFSENQYCFISLSTSGSMIEVVSNCKKE